jgi:hypothetical protein
MARIDDPDTRKIISFDPETWLALEVLGRDRDRTIQELADEAFADLLKKHRRPVSFRESLEESARFRPKRKRDAVETASVDSFPASDPPNWTPVRSTAANPDAQATAGRGRKAGKAPDRRR